MDDLPKNMTKAGAAASAFGMGNRHVPMPTEQGMASVICERPYRPRQLG
jgi:hypothetical protein